MLPTLHSRPYDLLAWFGLGLLTIALSRYTNVDLISSSWFFDANTGEFPLRDSFLFARVFHDGTHNLSSMLWLGCWIMAWRSRHTESFFGWLFVIISALIAVSINGYFKHQSLHSCPWSLSEFGGTADYFRAFSTLPAIPGPGRCLPSGHAGVGFGWIAMIYACTKWWPQHVRKTVIIVLAFSLFCGGIQVARGAHFITHVLWTAVICGTSVSICFHLYQYRHGLGKILVMVGQRLQERPAHEPA